MAKGSRGVKEVVVLDYDASWPALFERLRAPVWSAVADIAIAVEHVGSTAVPGLAAKPVIDMDVVVPAEELRAAIARVTALGYEHRGDLGVPQREAFRPPPAVPHHHLFVCPVGSPALANHIALRDYLRIHPAAAREYGALKRRLAREFPRDIEGYMQGKTELLVGMLRRLGFAPESLEDIVRINRRPGGAGPTRQDDA